MPRNVPISMSWVTKVMVTFAAMTNLPALAEVTAFPSLMEEKMASRDLSLSELVLVDMFGTQREILYQLRDISNNIQNITSTTYKHSVNESKAELLEFRLDKERNNTKYLIGHLIRLQDRVAYLESKLTNTSLSNFQEAQPPSHPLHTETTCKRYYEAIGKDCLRFKLSDTKTWQAARKECQNDGGDLAVNFDIDLVSARLRGETVFILHIGASNLYANGNWWWLRTGAAVETQYFAPGNPESTSGEPGSERCGALSRQFNFRVVDRSCQSKLPYICQILPDDIWRSG